MSSGTACNPVLPEHYSGKYKGSFAYHTIKDRLPVILVKVIDHLCQSKNIILELFGETAGEQAKEIIGRLSCLQNEMVTGKQIKPLIYESNDSVMWNDFLKQEESCKGFPPSWFESPWLYVECYLYRRIKQAFELSANLKTFDPFHKQKEDSFFSTIDSAAFLCSSFKHHLSTIKDGDNKSDMYLLFRHYLEMSLWGNKWDLSISAGKENVDQGSSLSNLDSMRERILVNDSNIVWKTLLNSKQVSTIDFILDNAGFELFCDLIFLHFICEIKLVSKVRLHVKTMPWFVSDTLRKDIEWLLIALSESKQNSLAQFSEQCRRRFSTGEWEIVEELFWTLPHDFSEMKAAAPELYAKLTESNLIVFKGDLNYRKLTGDRMWDEATDFATALNGFLPTDLVSLRTVKADVIVGLKAGTCEQLSKEYTQNWKYSGNFAVIQCANKL